MIDIKADKLNIEYVNIDTLKEYEKNAKIHTEEQIEQIMNSIKRFGMNDPIGVWKDNIIIEGHGRLQALKRLGIKKAPIIRLDFLTDEERRAYTLAHNKTTMNTDFDYNILETELDSIEDIDMTEFGFETAEDIDIDNFFKDKDEDDRKSKPLVIECPYCKKKFEFGK